MKLSDNDYPGTHPALFPVGMIFYRGLENWCCPTEEPPGLLGAHIDAAMTHLQAKIIMPIGAVEGIPGRGEEKARPGDSWQVRTIRRQVSNAHMLGRHLGLDVESAARRIPGDVVGVGLLVQSGGNTRG